MVMQLSKIHIIVIIYPGEYLHSFLNYKLTQELRTQLNHLASLAKWLSVRLRTKWFRVRVQLGSLPLKSLHLLRGRSSWTFRQLYIECRFTLKYVRDMTRTYSQMHCKDKNSEHSSIIWPVWLNV